ALLGSLLLALFVVPAASSMVFARRAPAEFSERIFEWLRLRYRSLLAAVVRHRVITLGVALAALGAAGVLLTRMGSEFMPKLDEGSILIESRKLPGVSVTQSVELSTQVEQLLLRQFPEISGIVTKIGRPDLATEAMGIHQGDVYVLLKPHEQWPRPRTKEQLIEAMDKALEDVPGMAFNFTQPMAMRLDEVVSGVKADLAVKIFGEDSRVLEQLGDRALRIVSGVRGAADAQVEIVSGITELTVTADRAALARYGLNVSDLRDAMEVVVSGKAVSTLIDGQRQFEVVVRLPGDASRNLEAVRAVLLPAPGGERVQLGQVAAVKLESGPDTISREHGHRRIIVQSNVRGRDLGTFVEEVRGRLDRELKVPPGYSIDLGGQFENQERATRRLMLVIPLTAGIIFALLYATFHSTRQSLLIILNVPFALVGGVAALWLREMNLNLSASVGFIALFGVAVLNGIVLVSSINHLREEGLAIAEATLEGASLRLRPVLMTALVASLGFLPMALSASTGAEVQRPLATVVIGGLFTSTLLTLFLLPVLYPWFSGKESTGAAEEDAAAEVEVS
ncbi:MAG: efflux RND transporter permease subunit, partial [Bryobacterales bacterium]|nr:efflux RND transporter permease subunit [Bryobacterales bacterium]